MKLTQHEALAEVAKIAREIEGLMKSSPDLMQKEDEQTAGEAPDPQEETAEIPPSMEGAPDAAGQEAPMDPAAEEGGDLSSHVAEMSDEELHELVEALLSELEARSGAGEATPEDPMAEEGAPAPEAPMAPEMDKSMKADWEGMKKSVADLTDVIVKQSKELETLKKSQAKPVVKTPVVANTRPAASSKVEVLNKSDDAPKATRLSKSETIEFLLGQQRIGNRLVNSDEVSNISRAKTEEALFKAQDDLVKKGIALPKL